MQQEKTTDMLDRVLQETHPSKTGAFLETYADRLTDGTHPFSDYMRTVLKEKGIRQQDVFLAADISEGYGYKLISGEKHTRRRDTILRLCLGGRLKLDEVQRALKLYGMAPLYSKIPRDAVLMIAINNCLYEIADVDALLVENGVEPLEPCA